MKVQMKFQKMICMATVIIGAIAFAISLGLLTNIYHVDQWAGVLGFGSTKNNLFLKMQDFNDQIVGIYIIFIILAALLFITNSHKRRNYYISNYINIILVFVFGVVTSIMNIVKIIGYKDEYLAIDFEELQFYIKEMGIETNSKKSTFWLDFNIVAAILVVIVSLLLLVNLIWKIRLMKGEKALLSANNIDKNNKEEVAYEA